MITCGSQSGECEVKSRWREEMMVVVRMMVLVVVIVELKLVKGGDGQYWLMEERNGDRSDSVWAPCIE